MTLWYLHNDERLSSERAALAALDARAPWLQRATWTLSGANLAIEADLLVGEVPYAVILEYPALFPASPPTVSPRDSGARWSGHQYRGTGELCLEWGPDNWEPHVSGAALLESAYKLLSTEKGDGTSQERVVASRHESSLGQELRGSFVRVALTPEMGAYLGDLAVGTTGTFEFRLVHRDGNATLHVVSIRPAGQEACACPALPKTLSLARGISAEGRFAKIDVAEDSFGGMPYADLSETLSRCGCDGALQNPPDRCSLSILILRDAQGKDHVLWLPDEDDGDVVQLRTFQAIAADGKRTGPGSQSLRDKRVGIVGLGSVGSKIALTLCRSGVRDFLLIDDDIFLPENLERHTLDFRNVGEHKATGVKAQLEALSADVSVEVAQLKLSGQEASSSVSRRLRQLADCGVIIDATADPRTFGELAETARQAGTAMVWCEVFPGGIGGLVARYRPGRDPDPLIARARLHAYLEDKEPAPGAPAEPYVGTSAEGEPIIASDAEVGIIAHHAARLVSDILEGREPSAFPNSMYLVGMERGWLFEEPFHTIRLDIGSPAPSAGEGAGALSKQNVEFLTGVIERGSGASSD